jgi:hypothetical protein
MKSNNGQAFGIDPYNAEIAREHDVSPEMKKMIDDVIDSLDFEQLHSDVLELSKTMGLSESTTFVRKTSAEGVSHFRDNEISIGMLHIDGNHDTAAVVGDVKGYCPMVENGGFVVLDDTDWDSVMPACELVSEDMTQIFDGVTFRIYLNDLTTAENAAALNFELTTVFEMFEKHQEQKAQLTKRKRSLLKRVFG